MVQHRFEFRQKGNLVPPFAFKSAAQIADMRALKEETTFTAAKLFTPSPPHFFPFFSFFFYRGKYTTFLFRTNKGLSPHHGVTMLGKRDWSLVFFLFFSRAH